MTTTTANTKLTLPKTDAEAIAFALDNLQQFEVADFLRDWREGKDLQWWIDSYEEDRKAEIAA